MTNEERVKLLERIEKLLALGTSSNPNEAAAAFAKAQALMQEYGISETTLEMNQIGEVLVKSNCSVSKPKDWEVALVQTVTAAFGCKIIWRPGHSSFADYWGRYIIVGHKDKLQLVEYTVTVMLRNLIKARNDYSSKLTKAGYRGKEKSSLLDGFAKGWVSAIYKKVVIFANPEGLDDLIKQYVKDVVTTDGKADMRKSGYNAYGAMDGAKAGANVDLHRPMNGGRETLQIGGN